MASYYRNRSYKKKSSNSKLVNRKLQLFCPNHGELVSFTQSLKTEIYESFNYDKKTVELKCYQCLEDQIKEKQDEVSRLVADKFGKGISLETSDKAYTYNLASAIALFVAIFASFIVWGKASMKIALINAGAFGIIAFFLWKKSESLEKKSQEIAAFRWKHSQSIISAKNIVETEAKTVSKWRIEQARIRKERIDYSFAEIDKMTGIQFEIFVKNLLEKLGYKNVQITKATGDEGVDILANKNTKKIAIQCKRYSKKLANKAIQEVFSGMHFYSCQEAYVITNSYFTENAVILAKSHNVKLIDRDLLFDLAESVNSKNNSLEHQIEFNL